MQNLDRRLHAYRSDLAAASLRDRVEAARFVVGTRRQVARGHAPLHGTPDGNASRLTELLHGEIATVYEDADGWAWVQNDTDGYVGYIASACLAAEPQPVTHRVAVLRTYVYPAPDLKTPPGDLLSMTAGVSVVESKDRFSRLSGGGWAFTGHLAATGDFAADFAAVALTFLGTPYLWGGRTSLGLDCSALVQLSLARCGVAVPRDSDMQAAALGAPVVFDGDEGVLERGDVVFWEGHEGIWIDRSLFLHANATDMMVSVGPLAEIAARIERTTGDRITTVRRPKIGPHPLTSSG